MGFLYRNFIGGPETEVENIIRNLGYILSTKRGAGSFLRDFGVSETGYRTLEEMVTTLGAELKETIEKYEPRLEVTEIEETYDAENRPMLAVHCAVKETGVALKISYDPRGRAAEISKKPPKKGRG
jgi:predicted component of type VI protein secretion system